MRQLQGIQEILDSQSLGWKKMKSDVPHFELTIDDEVKLEQLHVPIPANEKQRIKVLRQAVVLDTPAEADFDRYTRLASRFFKVPIALVSLVDVDRQWFKSRVGLDCAETHRDMAFCTYAVLEDSPDVFLVPDARQDPRFVSNPLVTGPLGIRFYAGAALVVEGEKVGTLCLIDQEPHHAFGPEQRGLLRDLARLVGDVLVRRRRESMQSVTREGAGLVAMTLGELQRPLQRLRQRARELQEELSRAGEGEKDREEMVRAWQGEVEEVGGKMQRQLRLALLLTSPLPPSHLPCPASAEGEYVRRSNNHILRWLGERGEEGEVKKGKGESISLRFRERNRIFLLHKSEDELISSLLPVLSTGGMRGGVRRVEERGGEYSRGELNITVRIERENKERVEMYLSYLLHNQMGGVYLEETGGEGAGEEGVEYTLSFPCFFPPAPPPPRSLSPYSPPASLTNVEEEKAEEVVVGIGGKRQRGKGEGGGSLSLLPFSLTRLLPILFPFPFRPSSRRKRSLIVPIEALMGEEKHRADEKENEDRSTTRITLSSF